MSIKVFTGARKALATSIALAAVFGSYTLSEGAYAAVSVNTTSSTTAAFTSQINRFTSNDFLNGVWRKTAGISVPKTAASVAAFTPGTDIRFADGQVRTISKVYQVGSNLSVYVDGGLLDGSIVGAPKTVSTVTSATTPAPVPEVTAPEVPAPVTPVPVTPVPSGIAYSALINKFTSHEWQNGSWRKSAGVSIQGTTANIAAFKVGATVKTVDGQVRTITGVKKLYGNITVFMNGAVLDGDVIGYPNKLTVFAGSPSAPEPAPVERPAPTPEPEPVPVPAPAPAPAPTPVVSSGLNNFTNNDWLNGIWRKSAGFTIAATSANQAAFKVGASVKLADGQIRKIIKAQVVGTNMSIFLDGAAIDGSSLGYPKTISVVSATGGSTAPAPDEIPSADLPAETAPPAETGQGTLQLVGVNLSAAGFGTSGLPGIYGKHYYYPDESYYKKYADNGLDLVRLPFLWERIQPKLNTPLDSAELARLIESLDRAQRNGVKVILDMHNYYRYYGKLIGSSEVPISSFVSVWKQIVQKVANHPAVDGYGLMNEPYGTNGLWPQAAEAAAKVIRTVDSKRWIYVAGDRYSSAYHWPKYNKTLISSPWMRDPKNNLVYEAHMYLDWDTSGSYADRSETFAPNLGIERAKPFVDWLKANNLRGFIGEHGVPDFAPSAMVAMDNLLTYLRQNCIPMTYWAAGPWWGEYVLSLDTKSGSYRPQLPVLKKQAATAHSCSTIGPMK